MEMTGVDSHGRSFSSSTPPSEEDLDLRRGPWTVEEDLVLMNYIANHGEGRWNSLARCAGLKRTGKSCRLRWLNYLRPDVRRGNITPEEQLLILELHSRWGNRWSKIAQHLPGRTDNEIKNYWRTRVQKHAKQLQCDVNSKQFKDVMRYLWMPRLVERIRAASGSSVAAATSAEVYESVAAGQAMGAGAGAGQLKPSPESESSVADLSTSSDSLGTQVSLPVSEEVQGGGVAGGDGIQQAAAQLGGWWPDSSLPSPCGFGGLGLPDFDQVGWWGGDAISENLWGGEDSWFMQQ